MYYLYKKKVKQSDDQNASTGGRTVITAPTTVQSRSSSSHQRRHLYQHQHPYPIPEEGQGSSTSLDVPEGLDSSHQPHHPSSSQRRRPAPASEDGESKQESKQKEEQVVRRMLRRRGLEEHDFTEEVMQPQRPNRINCQRCCYDIAANDNHHRILCSDRDRHVFCKACFVNYVEGWVEGTAHCDLRLGKQQGTGRGLHSLPCMSPACQKGCLQETSMQPLLPPTLFMSCRQKLAKVRSELSRSKPRGGGGGSAEASDQPPQRRNVPLHGSPHQPALSSRPSQPRRQQQQQQQTFQEQELFQQEQVRRQQQYLQHPQSQASIAYPHQQQQHQPLHEHHYQYHHQQQQQQHSMPLPPTAPRRTSTASTASAKTQKTQKSVRFSLAGNDDDLSTGSSASSLTTRFPVSMDDHHRKTEKEEANRRYRQMQLREQQKLQKEQDLMKDSKANHRAMPHQDSQPQQQHPVVNPNLTTCQCCYEDVSNQVSRVVSCGQRHPGAESHRFCSKCVRLYVEEWVFGAATYMLRPGPADSQGETTLVLPHGDCTEGGFPDEQVAEALSPRSMEQYKGKINSTRIQKQDNEERLVQMAIRLSLEQEEITRRVARLHQEQESITRGEPVVQPLCGGHRPPAAVNVPQTTLSNTSSLTSFNTAFHGYPRSLPDMPTRGTLDMKNLTSKLEEASKVSTKDQHTQNCEKSVHEVEEAMTQAKVRTCPNCHTKFLKDEDFCNKLKCPSCKTAICYICRQVIPTQGYEHFCIHKQGGCGACLGLHCPLWTQVDDDNRRDMAEMRARGLDEANRIWEESLLSQTEIRVDVDQLLQQPPAS